MSYEIITRQTMPPGMPSVEQTGTTNVNVTNQEGGTVNFNYILPQTGAANSAEMMMAIQSFSKQYYQILVTCEEDVFVNNIVTVSKDRALGQYYVPPEILERCSSLTEEGIAELKTFPAIICQENTGFNGETSPTQWAMYGYIKLVKQEGRDIKVAFRPIQPISQKILCDKRYAIYFDLNMDCAITDLNRSAWSVHKVNLFEAFDEAGLTTLPRPQ